MIFVFTEDGTLDVVDELAEAQRYDPFDVENDVFVFYDEDGTWLEARFSTPNRRGIFGRAVTPGVFELTRNSELAAEVDAFDVMLAEVSALRNNRHFDSIEAIRRHVATRRTKA